MAAKLARAARAGRSPSPATASASRRRKTVAALRDGDVAVLENLRFHKGEEKNDPAFARRWPSSATSSSAMPSRRRIARTPRRMRIARLLPSYAGPLLMEEVDALAQRAGEAGSGRSAAVIGGAKVSTKIDVLTNLAGQGRQADHRRRHGQHLLPRARAWRSASRWPSPTSPRRRSRSCMPPRQRQLRGRPAARRRWWRRSSRPARRRASCRSLETPSDQMILDVGPKTVAHYADVARPLQDAAVERPARRLRDRPVRRGHVRAGARGGGADQGRQARSRWPAAAIPWPRSTPRASRTVHLRLDGRRRVPRMAGGPHAAGDRGARLTSGQRLGPARSRERPACWSAAI